MQMQDLSADALAAIRRGDKLEAIRIVRGELRIGLKEAKDFVDAYVERHPDLSQALAAARSESNGRALWWLAAAAAFVVLVYVLYAKVGLR